MNHSSFNGQEYDRLIRPVAMVSRLVAIWPFKSDHGELRHHLGMCHRIGMIATTATMATAVSIDVVRHWNDMNEATECALIASMFVLSFVRMVNYTIHAEDMRYIVENMRRDWIEATPEDRTLLFEKCWWTFKLANQFIISVLFGILIFMVGPLFEMFLHPGLRVLPFRGFFMPNQMVSPLFEGVYFVTMIMGGLSATTITAATSFNFVSTMHAAARFALLQRRLKSVKCEDPGSRAAVIDCIERHQSAIEYAEVLERTINILALGQFVISTGLVCCAGFQLASMTKDKLRMMKYITFLNGAIFELFLFSFSGSRLIDESDAVGDSAYMSDWIGSSFSQNLQIIMLRASRPSKITAAKFYDMSLRSFSSVLSTSFSYFTVLQTKSEKN